MAGKRNVLAIILAGSAAVGALTGCGGDKDKGAAAAAQPSATVSTTPAGGLDSLTAQQISAKAKAVLTSASSLTMDLIGTEKGQRIRLKATLSKGGECVGTVGKGSSSMKFIATSHAMYMKGDKAFYAAEGPKGEAVAEMLHGRWMKMPAGAAKDNDMSGFCDLNALMKKVSGDSSPDGTFVKGGRTTVNGQPVIMITEKKPDGTSTSVYVAAEGKPYPLKIVMKGGTDPGTMTFSGYNRPVGAAAPPADQVVDITKLKS